MWQKTELEILEKNTPTPSPCLLYTSDAADEEDSVDLGGRRIIKQNDTWGLLFVF